MSAPSGCSALRHQPSLFEAAEALIPRFDPASFLESEADREAFRSAVGGFYAAGMRSFPWRESRDPWAVLVSEIMLQQTQTDRVLPKYLAFLERWPRPADLAAAPVAELLGAWSGLGYSRRALALQRAAIMVAAAGFPRDEAGLRALPGVGPYTARAVLCFAFGEACALFETNVRSVFLHAFFRGEESVPDARLLPLVEAALDREAPREWNWALMDLGVAIKKRFGNPNRRSASYAKQSPFADSNRRVRGSILKLLGEGGRLDLDSLHARLPFSRERVERAARELLGEGFLAEESGSYGLRS